MNIGIQNIKRIIMSIMILNAILFGATFSYKKYPDTIYNKQTFPIIIESLAPTNGAIEFIFDIEATAQPVSDKPIITIIGDTQEYKFFLKSNSNKVYTPKISILYDGKIETLDGIKIKSKKLPEDPNFCGIIANNLTVKTYQVSKYNKNSNIIMLSLEAKDGNAKDMHLDFAQKEASENVIQGNDIQTSSYYAIIDSSIKNILFAYYNTAQDKFIDISIPATVKDARVAAQYNPNPDFDQFEKLKKIIYAVSFLIAIFVYMKRKKKVYILIALIFLVILVVSLLPRSSICVKNGANIYVLPVNISKLDDKIDGNISTAKLGEQNGFIKIAYKPNKIGWIRVNDICEN